ncbi:hypothetical protein [Coxiella-like endosymbiont]|uniref:hypothetical protein n=1 Tax=Coxiella-like endosymbiont TaxID=1592897 RepID=UPI00272A9BD2|nr:hypothetical protein [Coxiella-like endosymbiont]
MNIAIKLQYQRRKFAEYFLIHAMDFTRARLTTCILLEMRVTNEAAIDFYKKWEPLKFE